jgi:hypothetical protein
MRGGIVALEEVVKSTSTAAELASLVLMRAALKTNVYKKVSQKLVC